MKNDNIISTKAYTTSKFLQNQDDVAGKTFKELGFNTRDK